MNIEYYFKIGNVESNTKPSSPTLENVKNWYNEFQTHEAEKDYTIYLVGSFAEKEFGVYDGKPYDVDVVLLGNIKDETALLSLLEFGAECGFRNDVMIDIWHNNKLMDLSSKKPFIQTRSYDTFIGSVTANGSTNTNTIKLWNGDGVKLESGLYQYIYPEDNNSRSWKKANKRLVDGSYKGIQKKLNMIL
jgi:predicted nucleotidyltransferase